MEVYSLGRLSGLPGRQPRRKGTDASGNHHDETHQRQFRHVNALPGGNGSASLLATSSEAVSTPGGNVKWTFSPGVEIRSDWQLVVENQNGIYEQHVMLSNPQAFDGLGNESYPAAATAPGRTFGLSLVIRYTSTEYPS